MNTKKTKTKVSPEESKKRNAEKYIMVLMLRETHKTLDILSSNYKLTNVQFLDKAIAFINMYGFDPKDLENGTPGKEIKKLRSSVVSFIRTQEKEILLPMVNKMDSAIELLIEHLKSSNPSLIKEKSNIPVSEITTPIQKGGFKIPTSAKSTDKIEPITETIPQIVPVESNNQKKLFDLEVTIEKKDKEIKRLKDKLADLADKISPKSFGSGYSIEITKEELEELKSL